jgi:hypothetical protein
MSRTQHEFEELESPVTLTVHTKSPNKWLLIDRETGVAYQGSEHGRWDKLIPKVKEEKPQI